MAVLEEVLEPAVNLGGMQIEFVAQVGNRHLLKMPLQDGDRLETGNILAANL